MYTEYIRITPMFPFDKITADAEIIIYGMGYLGKEYANQVLSMKYARLKYAVDQKWQQIEDSPVRVLSPEVLANEKDAIIVVAIENDDVYCRIRDRLIDMGVSRKKIIRSICFYSVSASSSRFIKHVHFQKKEITVYEGTHVKDSYLKFIESVRNTLNIKSVCKKSLIRMGKDNDGGYVMLDDFSNGSFAYSFGINNDVSWDDEIAELGYDVYMYDHTIDSLPYDRKEFHFFKQGITGDAGESPLFTTLENCIKYNGHENSTDMILKIDIEGCEWNVLKNIKKETLLKFAQIVIEFHGVFEEKNSEEILSVLRKLNQTHQVVHVHGNNHSNTFWYDGIPYPEVLEVTYISKEQNDFKDVYDVFLPNQIDMPNCPYIQEISLGYWNHICYK